MGKVKEQGLAAVYGFRKWAETLCCAGILLVMLFQLYPAICKADAKNNEDALVEKLRTQTTTMRGEKIQVGVLLRAIGRKAGVNVLVSEEIADTISLDLENVSLYDMFHLILETKGLRYYEVNKALVIEKADDFKKDQRDMVAMRLCPKFGQATGLMPELTVLKSVEGSLAVSANGSCFVVRDHKANVDKIAGLLQQLDRPMPQVHIKARIVTIDKSVSKDLGVKWGYTDLSKLPQDSLKAASDLSLLTSTSSIVFGFIRDTYTLDVELSALQKRKQLYVLSEPRVVVLDGQEAEIKQGKEVSYESGTQENRSTSFREAVLGLKVIPKILQDKFIKLDVKVTNDSVDENSTSTGQPILNRQEIRTNLFLEDGVTVVIGGIRAKGNDSLKGEVPWLANIPFIGELFKSTEESDRTFELLVFLTPTLLKGTDGMTGAQNVGNVLADHLEEEGGNPRLPATEDRHSEKKGGIILHPLETKN